MIIKLILFGFSIFFFIKMRQWRKKYFDTWKEYDKLTKEKSKLSNAVREKGITIDQLEKKNKDLQKELEE